MAIGRDNVLQICYLDSQSEIALQSLTYFIIISYMTPNKKSLHTDKEFNRLEILAYYTERLSWVIKNSMLKNRSSLSYTRGTFSNFINNHYNITRKSSLICKYILLLISCVIFFITFDKLLYKLPNIYFCISQKHS